MNWDDLRIAMAVHRSGSYSAASAQLRIDETTVARRLARLQRDLGVPLFEAADGVRKPTAQCKEILTHVEQFAQHIARITEVENARDGLVGRCRVAATDSVAVGLLAPRAARFLSENPGLTLQLLTSTENVNFSRWEADLAIRLRKPDKGDFTISKLADLNLLLLEPVKDGSSERERLVCAYPEDLEGTPESQHLAASGLLPLARCLTKNLLVVQSLLRSGACSAVLPEFLAQEFIDDDRIKVTKLAETREAWFLVQDHLKNEPATRAVIDWVRACFAGPGR